MGRKWSPVQIRPSRLNRIYRKENSVEKIWLKSYQDGVPAEINPDAYQSLIEVFEKSCEEYSSQPAYYNLGNTLTYSQIDQYSRDFAAYLQHELKLKKGDRFAIMMPNLLQYPIVMFGALRAGLIVVNVNPLYTADELSHQLADSGTETIVAVTNFASTIQKALPNLPQLKNVIITSVGDLLKPLKGWVINFVLKYVYKKIPHWNIPHVIYLKETLAKGKHFPFAPVSFTNQDIAFLQYTGGTTGISKGAILTHRNLIANIQQADAWFNTLLVDKNEVIITALPLYHIFSLTANCLYFTKIGGLNVLITNPRDIPSMIKEMRKFKFTAITGVNTLFNALMKNPQFMKLDFSHIHLALGGGMAMQKVVAEKWQNITHAPLLEAYGLTETSPCVTINPSHLQQFNGTIGLPVPSTDICILDAEENEVPIGQPGELAVKGPQVMKGYWNNPAETAKVFTKDGWLLTGDIASIDENGYVRLLERKKDMILVSGFNVYPNEVEDVLAQLKGVHEVAVVAFPDENSGEVPKVFIVKNDPNLTADNVIQYSREHLTPYKVPKYVEFVEELPKTNVGKILRRALRSSSVPH
ncbi:MAG: AMP-binding protein [Gammaproteobacteria bacterium]|nr:AMP-binding protein [Gammaproteobacteria bacterium]MCW5583644.1 AMP-binding protein [Gammaproteobacteria bacterium]